MLLKQAKTDRRQSPLTGWKDRENKALPKDNMYNLWE